VNLERWEAGTIAAVSVRSRALVAVCRVRVRLPLARFAVTRPPDYQDSRLVSWGNLTQAEAMTLVSREQDDAERAEKLEYLVEMFTRGGPVLMRDQAVVANIFTLHYHLPHGQ
jgi:hypothetical protein